MPSDNGRRGWLKIAEGYETMSDENGRIELVKEF